MTLSLDDLKKQFEESEASTNKNYNSGDWYPFWQMDTDQTATVRFLPDADPEAKHFLIEKWMHKLEVVVDGKTQKRSIPCLQMYGKPCPICDTAKKFYDEKDDDNGSRFYKKKSWLGQVVVVDSPFVYEEPEKQPKLITINRKIYESVKAAIMQGDLDAMPTDFNNGYNFRITKTKQGKWADYSTSRFSPKPSALNPDLVAGMELAVLKDKLPKEPSIENVNAILHSALTGDAYVAPKKADATTEAAAAPVTQEAAPAATTEVVQEAAPVTAPVTQEAAPVTQPAATTEVIQEAAPVAQEAAAPVTVTAEAAPAAPADTGDDEADAILAAIAARQEEAQG